MLRGSKRLGRLGFLIAGLSTGCAGGAATGSVSPIDPPLGAQDPLVLVPAAEPVAAELDAEIFAAIVEWTAVRLAEEQPDARVEVDPRPAVVDLAIFDGEMAALLKRVRPDSTAEEEHVRRRSVVVLAAGLELGDAGEHIVCGGTMWPPPVPERFRADCPQSGRRVIVILSRAHPVRSITGSKRAERRSESWVAWGQQRLLTPHGAVWLVDEFHIARGKNGDLSVVANETVIIH